MRNWILFGDHKWTSRAAQGGQPHVSDIQPPMDHADRTPRMTTKHASAVRRAAYEAVNERAIIHSAVLLEAAAFIEASLAQCETLPVASAPGETK